jgi:hypothetical protein
MAFYGCETWTIGSSDIKRLETLEMWCYRRMMKIPWEDAVSNYEILKREHEKTVLFNNIVQRRERLIGQLLRHEGLLKTVTEATVEGKMCRGRPRISFIQQIVSDVRCKNYTEMKRLTGVEGNGELQQTDLQIENDDDEYNAVI